MKWNDLKTKRQQSKSKEQQQNTTQTAFFGIMYMLYIFWHYSKLNVGCGEWKEKNYFK